MLHDCGVVSSPAARSLAATMKIAIAVTDNRVSGHAGQTRNWLVFDCQPGEPIPHGTPILLSKEQLPHHFKDDGPHPLHGIDILVAGSAGDGFIRHMAQWGAQVLLTGETDPRAALASILAGVALPDTRFDVTTTLCKLRDLFSRH
jgi:predicted Fe-Mo cluster-binding NifX family protein